MEGAGADEDRGQRFLEIVQKNVHRLNHLVTDLLSSPASRKTAAARASADGPAARRGGRHEPTAVRREQSVTVEGAEWN